MRGRIFHLAQGNFRRKFYELAKVACIPKELGHPHILRHSRAIELLKAGVPVTIVQGSIGSCLSDNYSYIPADIRAGGKEHTQREGDDII